MLKVCEKFGIHDFKTYVRAYALIDSILLAIIYENLSAMGMEYSGLDCSYVCTTSGYAWQCFLFKTGINLDFVRSKSMNDMINSGIRGGVSMNTLSVAEMNFEGNKLGHDPEKPPSRMIDNDIISLYSTAMYHKLPHSQFEWATEEELESIDWENFDTEGDHGFILMCDLSYPPECQERTLDLPLAPSRHAANFSELSKRQRQQLKTMGPSVSSSFLSQPRLMLHMYDKTAYVVHAKALKYYLRAGLKLKIHKAVKFFQTDFCKIYVDANVEKRKLARTPSIRAFLKLMNNGKFGKHG